MKRIFPPVLALVLYLGLCVPAQAAEFSDVPAAHSFREAISFCSEKGIVGGYSDGTFRPTNTVTRSNFVVMLSRAFYTDETAQYDTPEKRARGTFYPNYLALYYGQVLLGTEFCDGTATGIQDPAVMDQGISRADMAKIICGILERKGGLTVSEAEKNAAAANISDLNSLPGYNQEAVASVYALGIIGGYSDGAFHGERTMNRGQAATVIYRLSQRVPLSAPVEAPTQQETPVQPETPVQSETPAPTPSTSASGTLRNGEAITEANVTEVLNELKNKYPQGTDFSRGYAGVNSGLNLGLVPAKNCITAITNNYAVHNTITGQTGGKGSIGTTAGCGGWAAFVEDYIFGQNATFRKTTLNKARPGDLLIHLEAGGVATHIGVYVGPESDIWFFSTDATTGQGVYHIGWCEARVSPPNGKSYDVYTAYGD